ncbi:MAG: histidinol dehydrogenase, partial [Chitinophagaceae bacterium]
MKIYNFKDLSKDKVEELCSRRAEDDNLVISRVQTILTTVKSEGDSALLSYAEQFDNVKLSALYID